MTKLQTLLSYTHDKRRDTWASFGSPVVSTSTKFFVQNTVFQLSLPDTPGSSLHDAILFTVKDCKLPEVFHWDRYEIVNYTSGDLIDSFTSIISPYFNIILTASQLNAITDPRDTTFIPFQEPDTLLSITDHNIELILTDVGVPFITMEELEFSRDKIINNLIYPAVREYYKFFPVTTVENIPLSNNSFSIPIPPDPVFAPVEARVIPGVPVAGQGNQNPMTFFFDEVLLNVTGGGVSGGYPAPGNVTNRKRGFVGLNNISTTILERAARTGITNHAQRNRLRISTQEGKVTGYSTIKGTLQITWGSWNNTFENIPFNRQSEVRDLATAYSLRALGMLRSQANSTIPGVMNYEKFLSRADKLEEKIISLWQKSTKSTLVRLG